MSHITMDTLYLSSAMKRQDVMFNDCWMEKKVDLKSKLLPDIMKLDERIQGEIVKDAWKITKACFDASNWQKTGFPWTVSWNQTWSKATANAGMMMSEKVLLVVLLVCENMKKNEAQTANVASTCAASPTSTS